MPVLHSPIPFVALAYSYEVLNPHQEVRASTLWPFELCFPSLDPDLAALRTHACQTFEGTLPGIYGV
jgi:hypothetical protein